jgi:hypothetical protein
MGEHFEIELLNDEGWEGLGSPWGQEFAGIRNRYRMRRPQQRHPQDI